jgi:hypothetical protein
LEPPAAHCAAEHDLGGLSQQVPIAEPLGRRKGPPHGRLDAVKLLILQPQLAFGQVQPDADFAAGCVLARSRHSKLEKTLFGIVVLGLLNGPVQTFQLGLDATPEERFQYAHSFFYRPAYTNG